MKPLMEEDLIELGWRKVEGARYEGWYEKDNYFMKYILKEDSKVIVRLLVKDASIIDKIADPERIIIILKCPSRDHFELLQTMLL
jgi:hypothetical protein